MTLKTRPHQLKIYVDDDVEYLLSRLPKGSMSATVCEAVRHFLRASGTTPPPNLVLSADILEIKKRLDELEHRVGLREDLYGGPRA